MFLFKFFYAYETDSIKSKILNAFNCLGGLVSKNLTVLMFMIVALLMGAMSYLAVQVSQLNSEYHVALKTQSLQTVDQDVIDQNIAELRSQIKTQRKVIVDLSEKYSSLQKELNQTDDTEYLRAPEMIIGYPLSQKLDSAVVVSGFRLNYYQNQNKFFWDHLVKDSLPLKYDRQERAVQITQLKDNSLFHQFGFEEGDYIQTINGKRILSGSVLRDTLLDSKTKTVAIKRDGKAQTFKIQFKDRFQDDVALSLKEGFDHSIKRYISELGVSSAQLDSGEEGISFQTVQNVPSLAALQLKTDDVITKINGRQVTPQSWATLFNPVSNRIDLEYNRNGQTKSLFVWIQD